MKKPIPKNTKTGLFDIAVLVIMGLLLLPMAAGPRAVAEEKLSEVKPLSAQKAMEQEKQILDAQIKRFNNGDLEAFLSAYTDGAISLPHEGMPAIGKLGLQISFAPVMSIGIKILEYDFFSRDMWSCGNYVITASQDKITIQEPSAAYPVSLLRNYLRIYELQPDSTLKLKMEAWNKSDIPTSPRTDSTFHNVETESISTEALNEIVESVKQLDIEFHNCFNRHDLDAAIACYAPDATLMTIEKNPIRGAEALGTYIIEGSQANEHISNNQQVIHAEGNDQMVIIVNQFGWVFKVKETGQIVNVPGKGIHVWQKQPDGQWKILLDIHNTNIPTGW